MLCKSPASKLDAGLGRPAAVERELLHWVTVGLIPLQSCRPWVAFFLLSYHQTESSVQRNAGLEPGAAAPRAKRDCSAFRASVLPMELPL